MNNVVALMLTTPYLQRSLCMVLVLAVCGGVVGTVVNVHRKEFNAEAMVHSVFPGIVLGAAWSGTDGIMTGAGIAAALVVLALSTVAAQRYSEDVTAIVLSAFFALGVVLSLRIGDTSGQLEALMFGRLLEVTDHRLHIALVVSAVGLLVVAGQWRTLVAAAFDMQHSVLQGKRAVVVRLVVNAGIAAVVVAGAQAVGVMLVLAFMVVPGAAARLVASSVNTMVMVAVGVGVVGGVGGLVVALMPWPRPVSPQASVALGLLVVFGAIVLLRSLWRTSRFSQRPEASGTNNPRGDIQERRGNDCERGVLYTAHGTNQKVAR